MSYDLAFTRAGDCRPTDIVIFGGLVAGTLTLLQSARVVRVTAERTIIEPIGDDLLSERDRRAVPPCYAVSLAHDDRVLRVPDIEMLRLLYGLHQRYAEAQAALVDGYRRQMALIVREA